MDVVTVATYAKPEEAHLARLRLCREDIPAFVIGENTVQMAWTWTILVGGVKLQVAEEDFDRARELLKAEPVVKDGPTSSVACPNCGSEQVHPYSRARTTAGLSLLLGLPLFFFTRWHRWECSNCGHSWR